MNEPDKNSSPDLISVKLKMMLQIQDSLNSKVNPDWRNADYNWSDAIMVEAVELFDHLNWKWWKKYKSEPDWGQVRMEAVDIWHFIMSEFMAWPKMQGGDDDGMLDSFLRNEAVETPEEVSIKANVRELLAACGSAEEYDPLLLADIFADLIASIGMTFDDLFRLYVGKAILNEFRWANGYGTTYIKDWLGEEDNQFLTRLINSLDVNSPNILEQISSGLADRYKEVVAAQTIGAPA